ncbi:MAG TPA: hypothetical protein DCL75_21425 [Ktedonobacter sp.]|nr:hypothetical protein [Ktedonobacter sp.]
MTVRLSLSGVRGESWKHAPGHYTYDIKKDQKNIPLLEMTHCCSLKGFLLLILSKQQVHTWEKKKG